MIMFKTNTENNLANMYIAAWQEVTRTGYISKITIMKELSANERSE